MADCKFPLALAEELRSTLDCVPLVLLEPWLAEYLRRRKEVKR